MADLVSSRYISALSFQLYVYYLGPPWPPCWGIAYMPTLPLLAELFCHFFWLFFHHCSRKWLHFLPVAWMIIFLPFLIPLVSIFGDGETAISEPSLNLLHGGKRMSTSVQCRRRRELFSTASRQFSVRYIGAKPYRLLSASVCHLCDFCYALWIQALETATVGVCRPWWKTLVLLVKCHVVVCTRWSSPQTGGRSGHLVMEMAVSLFTRCRALCLSKTCFVLLGFKTTLWHLLPISEPIVV